MILSSFSYKEPCWELCKLSPLSHLNLLVGKNATGKTRAINALQSVTLFLQAKHNFFEASEFSTTLEFSDLDSSGWKMSYSFSVSNGTIENENLIVNDQTLIKRTKTRAQYYKETVNPPSGKLLTQSRRDEKKYPEIEKLMTWAEGVVCVSCSNINPYTILASGHYNPISFSEIVERLCNADKKSVFEEAKLLGYDISEISTVTYSQGFKLVQVKEKNVKPSLLDMSLSNGMLRTLYILCFLTYMKKSGRNSLLLIDDLGEGLDYHRTTHLGKLVCSKLEKQQVVMSTNDAFLMDIIDINNWHILRRKGGKVSVINSYKDADLFQEFRMTGLSNYDFFSSDFIDSYLSKSI